MNKYEVCGYYLKNFSGCCEQEFFDNLASALNYFGEMVKNMQSNEISSIALYWNKNHSEMIGSFQLK